MQENTVIHNSTEESVQAWVGSNKVWGDRAQSRNFGLMSANSEYLEVASGARLDGVEAVTLEAVEQDHDGQGLALPLGRQVVVASADQVVVDGVEAQRDLRLANQQVSVVALPDARCCARRTPARCRTLTFAGCCATHSGESPACAVSSSAAHWSLQRIRSGAIQSHGAKQAKLCQRRLHLRQLGVSIGVLRRKGDGR